jgi:hypothetical protein
LTITYTKPLSQGPSCGALAKPKGRKFSQKSTQEFAEATSAPAY